MRFLLHSFRRLWEQLEEGRNHRLGLRDNREDERSRKASALLRNGGPELRMEPDFNRPCALVHHRAYENEQQ